MRTNFRLKAPELTEIVAIVTKLKIFLLFFADP